MKKFASLLLVGIVGGAVALGTQKIIDHNESKNEDSTNVSITPTLPAPKLQTTSMPNYDTAARKAASLGIDFTVAAEETVNAVVHVKNVSTYRRPRNYMDYLRNGGKLEKAIVGAGSGVIITEDGYIVTNNHVIKGASEVRVTLNNNKSYEAKIIGSDPNADIALLKIASDEKFDYIPFGNSDNTKIGEWVLAVGNPFNLTSTVTAGIISAKARDLDENDRNMQSFIQTDAAINPGNSGGALVNTKGELIGINTAITSQTGSYVGYAFAVPSNNARKIVEDILEYGDVQKAILGISGGTFSQSAAKELGINYSQGVFVSSVSKNSGAEKSGVKKGDIIKKIDGYTIRKFSDLTGYINSKRPNDVLNVSIMRNDKLMNIPVTLSLYESYQLKDIGIEIINATESDLAKFGAKHGVKINQVLSNAMKRYGLEGYIITEIDDTPVNSVSDVKKLLQSKAENEDIMVSFLDQYGEKKHFVFN